MSVCPKCGSEDILLRLKVYTCQTCGVKFSPRQSAKDYRGISEKAMKARSRNWDLRRLRGMYYTVSNIVSQHPELMSDLKPAQAIIDGMITKLGGESEIARQEDRFGHLLEAAERDTILLRSMRTTK